MITIPVKMTSHTWILDAIERSHARMRGKYAAQPLFSRPLWRDAEGNVLVEENGQSRYVMVMYERPYMDTVAEMLCATRGDILNVGFGCGLVDDAISARRPRSHTIVEAHETVLQWMRERGLFERARVIASRWEDMRWAEHKHAFDAAFFDHFPFLEHDGVAPSERLVLWAEVVRHIVRPGGLCVAYGPSMTKDDALRILRSLRVPRLSLEERRCVVEVPFVVTEWEHAGVGRHEVSIFGFRFPL